MIDAVPGEAVQVLPEQLHLFIGEPLVVSIISHGLTLPAPPASVLFRSTAIGSQVVCGRALKGRHVAS